MGTVPIAIKRMLDKVVGDPALVRSLKPFGKIKIRDDEGQVVEIGYEKTQAGYINFSHVDETIQMRLSH